MKNWYFVAVAPFLAASLLGSCSISDSDRCPAGFTYETTLKACMAIPDASANAGDTTTPAADVAVSEAGAATFGTTCSAASECASADTNYCVVLPGTGSGYCSKAQCTSECPSDYRCCNCAAFGLVVCLKAADAALAASAYGCSCS